VCLDDIIVDLKLTPDALEMQVPRYFRDDREAEIKKREELMNTLLVRFDIPPEDDDHKVTLTILDLLFITCIRPTAGGIAHAKRGHPMRTTQ
jgi:hypothetical protein